MIWDTPIWISNKQIKNRIVFPPISPNWANPDGSMTEKILNFYSKIAKGGCGMIVVCGTSVSLDAKGADRSLSLSLSKQLPGYTKLADLIKKESGCFAAIQLMHVGGQGNPIFTGGAVPVSASGQLCRTTGIKSRELLPGEIKKIIENFISSSLLASRAGFDAVELHLAHGYLLHEFLSLHTNKRHDKYGGSVENRSRIIIEIIKGIREQAPGLIIGARISGEDYLDDGITREVNKKILPILEKAGFEYFSVTAGIYETSAQKHEAMAMGKFFDYASGVKSLVSKPVIGVGKILSLEAAEKNLLNNSCDLVAIGRGLVADPFLVSKEQQGLPYNKCLECGECQYLRFNKHEMSCPQWEKEDN
jgi:2,4-dienoyl-CoA reductase-like NADH-dependent reductase (Old Yellow Enzyme family)